MKKAIIRAAMLALAAITSTELATGNEEMTCAPSMLTRAASEMHLYNKMQVATILTSKKVCVAFASAAAFVGFVDCVPNKIVSH